MSTDQLFRVIFVLGGPGAGKGTQCQRIVEKYGYVHLSAGDLLRQEQNAGGEIARQIAEHIVAGTIVPVAITCELLAKAMEKSAPKKHFLVDGFPRNQDNFEGWMKAMSDKVVLQGVLVFDCSDDLCVERCISRGQAGSGRTDDNAEALMRRLVTFKQDTQPIIDHYVKENKVFKIDATPEADTVFSKVQEVMDSLPK